jgi:ADP-dependent phosphofructokinase/glucokinase
MIILKYFLIQHYRYIITQTKMRVERKFTNGTTKTYEYQSIRGMPIANYKKNWKRDKRLKMRLQNGKLRAEDISPETVKDMREQQQKLGLSYSEIANMYGVSRYIAHKIMQPEHDDQSVDEQNCKYVLKKVTLSINVPSSSNEVEN